MPKVVAQSPIDTGDPAVDLLAAIVRRAVEDATKGSAEAEHFLNNFCPEIAGKAERIKMSKQSSMTTKVVKTYSKPAPKGEFAFKSEYNEAVFRGVLLRLPEPAVAAILKRLALVTDSAEMALAEGGAIDEAACVKSTANGDVIFVHPKNLIGAGDSYIEAAIAHELGHVCLGHAAKGNGSAAEEEEVDDLVASWGFRRLVAEAKAAHANRIVVTNQYI